MTKPSFETHTHKKNQVAVRYVVFYESMIRKPAKNILLEWRKKLCNLQNNPFILSIRYEDKHVHKQKKI